MNRPALRALAFGALLLTSSASRAGFTETLPEGTFLLDESISQSTLRSRYDNSGAKTTLIDPIERYELGSGLQGILTPKAEVNFLVLINMLQYGILDNLSFGLGIPVVLYTDVNLDLQWTPGDYQSPLARAYSEQDFWEWAESLGQPKPQDWHGNTGVLSDIILGLRYRFSDDLGWFDDTGLASALMVMGALPTGRQANPEEVAAAGTTMWDLHSQGELSFHLSFDYAPPGALGDHLTLGLDLFYEFLFEHEYVTPKGTRHPLLLRAEPYAGETYTLDPGDFAGLALQFELVPWHGPAWGTWLTDGDASRAENLPPLFQIIARYTYTHLGQSDWESDSAIWDWEKEKLWRPGYKNTLWAKLTIGLLRLGVPLQLYVAYRNQSWIGGRNSRAADVITGGLMIPAKFW